MQVELHRIGGDIYLNGVKIIFAVDFDNPPVNPPRSVQVDWLIGWAKVGLASQGHTFFTSELKEFASFETKELAHGDKASGV